MASIDSSPAASTYHVVTAVWGAEFIELFLQTCVPNQLSPGNLPALPPGSRYRVLTTAADAPTLAQDGRLDPVRRVLPVDVVAVDMGKAGEAAKPGQIRNRYQMMTACHRRAVADAADVEAALIFLAPDIVLAEGTIGSLVRLHREGYRAVLTANLRLARERVLASLARAGRVSALAPRELVRLAMSHLHPATDSMMVDGETANDFPVAVYWPVPDRGALDGVFVRSLSLHPLLLDPVRRRELPRFTIDGHYLMRCCPKLKQCHVVDDSDELIVFELTPEQRSIGNRRGRRGVSMTRLADVAGNCDRYQLANWERPIRIHAGSLDARWDAVERESAQFIRRFERYQPYGPTFFRVYRALNLWRQRRERYVRTARQALPSVSSKSAMRPARLFVHRTLKAGRLALKRVRRRVGL